MKLSLQTFTSLVQSMSAATQSASRAALDLSVGSTIRSILEGSASIGLWIQWLILQVLQMTRAATSSGADLDSWMADFSLIRLPATFATGTVTFSRLNPGFQASIPSGALVRTADTAQLFAVVADAANPYWSGPQNAYLLPAGTATAEVPVTAQAAGGAGNVQAGAITMLATPLPGVDAVTNSTPFFNGMDQEADSAFRGRFQGFLASRARATSTAVGFAVRSVQQNLTYTINENVDEPGNRRLGHFVVTVDDGSGVPSQGLLEAVYAAIDAVRPIGSTFSVRPPVVIPISVWLRLELDPSANPGLTSSKVVRKITDYVDSLGIGLSLPLTRIAQLAYDADDSIRSVGGVLLDNSASDIVPPSNGVLKVAQVVVS